MKTWTRFRSSYETGLEARFLNNRTGFDVTFFTYVDGPQIFAQPISSATGYDYQLINAVKTRKQGWEVSLSGTPLRKSHVSWDVLANWSTYRETFAELPEGTEVLNRFFRKGDRVDKYYDTGFVKTPEGQIVNDASGRPIINPVPQFLGYANPDWVWSLINTFRYKNLSLAIQVDGRVGGVITDHVQRQTFRGGRHIDTVEGAMGEARYQDYLGNRTWVGPGVVISNNIPISYDTNGNVLNFDQMEFAGNTTATFLQDWISRYYQTAEANLMDKSYAKLREVTLTYEIPSRFLKRQFVNRASISLVARNLLYFAEKKDIDLDQYITNSVSGMQTPTTRRFGLNLNVVF